MIFGGEILEEDKSLEQLILLTKDFIKDPFSLKRTDSLQHATTGYTYGILEQVKHHNPDSFERVKERILEHIHPDDRKNFWSNLDNAFLFVDGATYEVICRIASQYAPVDNRVTLLHLFLKRPELTNFGAKVVGPDRILKEITKAASNVTSAIIIKQINLEDMEGILGKISPADKKWYRNSIRCFSYKSKDDYREYMTQFFDEEDFATIEENNLKFTMDFVRIIPLAFTRFANVSWDPSQPIEKFEELFGDSVVYMRKDNDYYFAIQYPPVSLWQRIKNVLTGKGKPRKNR